MILKTIKHKVTFLVSIILLSSLTISFITTYWNINQSQTKTIGDSFRRSEQIFETLISNEKKRLENGSKLVGVLPVLVAVVESGDAETVEDTIKDYKESLNVSFIDIYDSEALFLAGLGETSNSYKEGLGKRLSQKAMSEGSFTTYVIRNGKLVVVAVSPIGSGYSVSGAMIVGIPIDNEFAIKVQKLTSLNISFFLDEKIKASSLSNEEKKNLENYLMKNSIDFERKFELNDNLTRKYPIVNCLSENIGEMFLQVSLKESKNFFSDLILYTTIESIIIFSFFVFIGVRFSENITLPLTQLQNTAEEIESSLNYSLRVPEKGRDEIFKLSQVFNRLLNEIGKNHKKLKEYSKNLERKVDERTKELVDSNASMTALLDNLDEGFMVFDADGIIQEGSSKASHRFFSMDPTNTNLSQLLHINDEKGKKKINDWLEVLFGDNALGFDSLAAIGPKSFTKVGDNYITLEYRPVFKESFKNSLDKVIIIASDKTKEKELEAAAQLEKATANLVISILNDKDAFIDFIEETRQIFNNLNKYLMSEHEDLNVDHLFRFIHTVKGGCASFHFIEVAKCAHRLENFLAELKTQDHSHLIQKLNYIREETKVLKLRFEQSLIEHRNIIGDLDGKAKLVKNVAISDIVEFSNILRKKYPKGLDVIDLFENKFIFEDLSKLFLRYEGMVSRVAQNQGKSVVLEMKSTDIYVDHSFYKPLTSACIHIFRNAIDHGIEDSVTRKMIGKESQAKIKVRFIKVGEDIVIIIEDDGQGIDESRISKVAIEKGIKTEVEISKMEPLSIMQLVFHPGFSTKRNVTDLSGRGVGLDAVKYEAKQIGGSVMVKSKKGKGCQFIIKVPFIKEREYESTRLKKIT